MKLSSALALTLLTPLAAFAGDDTTTATWYADFDEAAEVAEKQSKDLLVDFTGSDWCGWCIKLHDEVFQHDEFLAPIQENYVLVALDYPRGEEAKAQVPNPERNAELKDKYEISGFPTVLLMTAAGEVYGQTGYREGGPEAYVEHVQELRQENRKALVQAKKAAAAFEAAPADEKAAAWEGAMKAMEELPEGSPLASLLVEPVRWALTADPENEKGMKLRAVKALLKVGQTDAELLQAARGMDPKNEQGLRELALRAQFMKVEDDASAKAAREALDELALLGIQDQEIGFDLYFTMARWCAGPLEDPEGKAKYVAAAKAIGTDDQEMLDYLEQL